MGGGFVTKVDLFWSIVGDIYDLFYDLRENFGRNRPIYTKKGGFLGISREDIPAKVVEWYTLYTPYTPLIDPYITKIETLSSEKLFEKPSKPSPGSLSKTTFPSIAPEMSIQLVHFLYHFEHPQG